jgi:hypothetical protein
VFVALICVWSLYPLQYPGIDTVGKPRNPLNPVVATYWARRPLGAWRTKGPPAGSAVVCGWGRPATVPPGATVAWLTV